jgi:predicted nucleotidyltransferase
LQSPIIYKEGTNFARELRSLMPDYFSLRAGCHHYLSMTRNTFEYDLQGEQVKLKRYFYALRPALACRWILEKKTVPPMEFGHLRTLVTDTAWQDAVDDLLKRKMAAEEKTFIAPVALLQQWLAHVVMESKTEADALPVLTNGTDQLDKLFRKYIGA